MAPQIEHELHRIKSASSRRIGRNGRVRCRQLLLLLATAGFGWWLTTGPLTTACSGSTQSGSDIGAALFSADTTVYVRLEHGGEIVERLLNHPLRAEIEALDQVKAGLKSAQFTQAKIAVGLLEGQIGAAWLPALKALTGGGVHIGIDARRKILGVAIQSDDEELLKKTAGAVLGFVKGNNKGNEPPFEVSDVPGGKVARFDKASIARAGNWFLASNSHEALLEMVERLDAGGADPATAGLLAASPAFLEAWNSRDDDADGFVFANLQQLRDAGVARELFAGATDQPPVELLFGGILEGLRDATFVSANVTVNQNEVAASIRLPFDAENSPEKREFFFGNQGMGRAPRPVEIPDLIGQLVTYRNLGSWWLSKEDLFPENVVAQLAQGDSQLSTIFGGVDFGADVLGGLQPEMRLLVKGQTYAEGINPDVKLPAFALVSRLQNPDNERRFRISFQSLVGLLNLNDSGMERPQIELVSTREDDIQITGGQYFPDGDYSGELFVFNFSPAMAFYDDYMIVSSSMEFAREIAQAIRDVDDNTATSDSNTLIELHAAPLKRALVANRETLVANSMVERGIGRRVAESQVDLLLGLLDYARDFRVDLRIAADAMQLDARLQFAVPPH